MLKKIKHWLFCSRVGANSPVINIARRESDSVEDVKFSLSSALSKAITFLRRDRYGSVQLMIDLEKDVDDGELSRVSAHLTDTTKGLASASGNREHFFISIGQNSNKQLLVVIDRYCVPWSFLGKILFPFGSDGRSPSK